MVMTDLKVSSLPVELPKPKPPPAASQPSPARLPASPGRISLVSRQLGTPQKTVVRSPQRPSPTRLVAQQRVQTVRGRGVMRTLGQPGTAGLAPLTMGRG